MVNDIFDTNQVCFSVESRFSSLILTSAHRSVQLERREQVSFSG
jgi:hypothetical protein